MIRGPTFPSLRRRKDALAERRWLPLTTKEIVAAIVAEQGYGPEAVSGMGDSIRSTLAYLLKVRGSITREGERETARWKITD